MEQRVALGCHAASPPARWAGCMVILLCWLNILAPGVHAFSCGLPLSPATSVAARGSCVARRIHRTDAVLRRWRPVSPSLALMAGDWQEATDPETGKVYYWSSATGETSWTLPETGGAQAGATSGDPGGELPIQFTGVGTRARVIYKKVLEDALASLNAARVAGKRRLQIEFPLNDEDEGKTLVKRFELMETWTQEFAMKIGLPRVQRVGEDIQIRDNITPGGGGEYLTNEGVYGYRLSNADNSEQVLLVLVAGVDIERLNDLEALVQGKTDVGRQLPGGMALEVASTGVLSSLDTVGYVREMSVKGDATIVLINSGLDKVLASGGGLFGIGGASKFLKSFEPCYYIKRASTGFIHFDARCQGWRLWGVPRDATELAYSVVSSSEQRPAFWEAEQKIKALCRS